MKCRVFLSPLILVLCLGCAEPTNGPTYAEAVTIYEFEFNELNRLGSMPSIAQRTYESQLAAIADELREGKATYDARYKNIGNGEDRNDVESWWSSYVRENDAKKKAAKESLAARLVEIDAKISEQQLILKNAIEMRDKARQQTR